MFISYGIQVVYLILSLMFIPDPTKVIHTEMMLAPEEFDNYQIGVDTDVTFCLKELRVKYYQNHTAKVVAKLELPFSW